MNYRLLAVAFVLAMDCAATSANAQYATRAEPDRLWISLLIQSPIPSVRDQQPDFSRKNESRVEPISDKVNYDQRWEVDIPKTLIGTLPPRLFQEVRRVSDQTQVVVVPFGGLGGDRLPPGTRTSWCGLDLQRFPDLQDGEYVAAVIQDDWSRISNVAPFVIDSQCKIDALPVLEAVVLEPPPYRTIPLIGVRVAGSQHLGEPFKYSDVPFATLKIDGIAHVVTGHLFIGMDATIGPGFRWLAIVDPAYREPPVPSGGSHTAQAIVGKYESNAVNLTLEQPMGQAWDTATDKMAKTGRKLRLPPSPAPLSKEPNPKVLLLPSQTK